MKKYRHSLGATIAVLVWLILVSTVSATQAQDAPWPAEPVIDPSLDQPAPAPPEIRGFEASSDRITLLATSDTFIASDAPDTGYSNYAINRVPLFLTNYYAPSNGILRGLVKFDTSGFAPGTTVENATLHLYLGVYWLPGPTVTVTTHRINSFWYAGITTWNNQHSFFGEPYGSAQVGQEFGWHTFDVTDLVQVWLDGTYPDCGIMLRGPESGITSLKGWLSHRMGNGYEPRLTVHYRPDTTPPTSAVLPLPPYQRDSGVLIIWEGQDDKAGIDHYEVQYREANETEWHNWLSTTQTSAPFTMGEGGHSYSFRCRAADKAGNVQDWSSTIERTTTLFTWNLTGHIGDVREAPIAGVTLSISPEPVTLDAQNATGRFVARLGKHGDHEISTAKSGYAPVPPLTVPVFEDLSVSITLPPEDDGIVNGGFESGLAGWRIGGDPVPELGDTGARSGRYVLRMGPEVPEIQDAWNYLDSNFVYVPDLTGIDGNRSQDPLFVASERGADAEPDSVPLSFPWEHRWVDLDPWAGQPITVTFAFHSPYGESTPSTVSQTVTLSDSMHAPTLSFYYAARGEESLEDPGALEVRVTHGVSTTQVLLMPTGSASSIYLDDITLGSSLTPKVSTITPGRYDGKHPVQVTLTGSNFVTPTVDIGGLPLVEVTMLDSGTLTATVPAGLLPGLHDVIVTNATGHAGGLARVFGSGYCAYLPAAHRVAWRESDVDLR